MSVRDRDCVEASKLRKGMKPRWASPQLRRLQAGSAEQTSNNNTDLGVNQS